MLHANSFDRFQAPGPEDEIEQELDENGDPIVEEDLENEDDLLERDNR
jgi:hypothetical protein